MSEADNRVHGRRKLRSIVMSIGAVLLIGLLGVAIWRISVLNSDDEKKIAAIDDADWIRGRIADNKKNPAFSRHTLAALYCRLIDLDGDGGKATLADALEAYRQLVSPDLKDVSYYTWYIASVCGYSRFKEHDFYEAARCEDIALDIFDKAPFDVRMLTPSLLEDINILMEDCANESPVDHNKIHAAIERSLRYWKEIETKGETKNIPSFYRTCGDIFSELAFRCQRGGAEAEAITSYRQAALIYARVPDPGKSATAEQRAKALEAQAHGSISD